MGIPGLLVALKSYLSSSTTNHTSTSNSQNSDNKNNDSHNKYNGNIYADFHNQAVAVDASSWFHKSVYSIADHYVECIEKLNLDSHNNNATKSLDAKCINTSLKYMLGRCYELLSAHGKDGVSKIYLVMDGERCPLKAITNQERTDKRNKSLQLARKYKLQQQPQSKIYEQYKTCIKVVNELSYTVARKIEQHFASDGRVEVIWSPFEADAQLVQLCSGIDGERICSAVITEDSDVLVYSAACHISFPIIYKLDRQTGNCSILSMDWLIHPTTFRQGRFTTTNHTNQTMAVDMKRTSTNHKVSTIDAIFDILVGRQIQHSGWGTRLFVQGCVLAGCDYSPRGQIPGVGFTNAFKYIQMAGLTPNQLDTVFDRILTSLLPMKSRRLIQNALSTLEIQLSQSEAVFYYHPVLKQMKTRTNSHRGMVQYLTNVTKTDNEMMVYQPSLRRYDNDLSFLGSLTMNRSCLEDSGIIPKNMVSQQQRLSNRKRKSIFATSKNDLRPTKSIFIHSNISNATSNDEISAITSATSSQEGSVQNENRDPTRTLKQSKTTINPYQQKRQPLQSLNPFEAYAKRHNEVGILESNRIVTAKLPVRSNRNSMMNRQIPSDNDENKNSDLFCHPPLILQPTMTTAIYHRSNVDDVRFVKRTDFGVDINAENHIYRPPMGRYVHPIKVPLPAITAMQGNIAKQRSELKQPNIASVVVASLPTAINNRIPIADVVQKQAPARREPRKTHQSEVESKFSPGRLGENNGPSNTKLFEVHGECPLSPQSKLDVVSLVDFDLYESQNLLSPTKSLPTFRQDFDYDIPKEFRQDKTRPLLVSHAARDISTNDFGPASYRPETFGTACDDNMQRPESSHPHRRVTLEFPHDKTVEYDFHEKKPSKGTEPMQFNFYDTLPLQSPINQVGAANDVDVDETATQNVDEDIVQPIRPVKTLKYRFGSVMSVKDTVKKVVKRSNVIHRVVQNHRKRSSRPSTKRDPAQTTMLTHFHTDYRAVGTESNKRL